MNPEIKNESNYMTKCATLSCGGVVGWKFYLSRNRRYPVWHWTWESQKQRELGPPIEQQENQPINC